MTRPDQENIDTLLAHGKRVSYGTSWGELTWHKGLLVKWKVTKVEEGHQSPLKKVEEEPRGNL